MNYEELLDKIMTYNQIYLNETVLYAKQQLWKIIKELSKMYIEALNDFCEQD